MPPGSIGVVAAPTYRMLYDATLMTFHEVCGKFIAPNGFSKSEMRVRLIDDKVILFRSADDPERLRGPNLGWFWLDEAALMPELAWEIMIGRLRLQPGRLGHNNSQRKSQLGLQGVRHQCRQAQFPHQLPHEL